MWIAGQYHFRVMLEEKVISFAKISGMEQGMEYEVLQEGGNNLAPRLLPVQQKQFRTLKLERAVQAGRSTLEDLYPGKALSTGVQIEILNERGEPVKHYAMKQAVVVRREISALDAQGNGILYETLEIAYSGIK